MLFVKDMAAKKGDLRIVVGTKVCRYTDGVYTNGVVSAITITKKGKQKVPHSMYCILFQDKERLNCGVDTVKAMQACFTSRAKIPRTNSEAAAMEIVAMPPTAVQNRKLMMDSSGKHIPFAGVKRYTDDTRSTARGKAKKPKKIRKVSSKP